MRTRGGIDLPDIAWFRPDGTEMSEEDWEAGFGKSVAVFLNGQGIPDLDARGKRVVDDSFMLAFNAHYEAIEFTLPPPEFGTAWALRVDTAAGPGDSAVFKAGEPVAVAARAMVVLQQVTPEP